MENITIVVFPTKPEKMRLFRENGRNTLKTTGQLKIPQRGTNNYINNKNSKFIS